MKSEWAVIDDELLARALVVPPNDEDEEKETAPPTDLVDAITHATALELSHCRIRRIDHLDGFRRLTRLRLDNNGIATMENLEGLVHLTWLDLSFNRIERVQGLESLRKLTDLSLYHNRLGDLQGLAHAGCRGLQFLSLGRNRLDLSDPAALLRPLAGRFPALEALVLHGQQRTHSEGGGENKIKNKKESEKPREEESFEAAAVVAVLPRLLYLDHRLLLSPNPTATAKAKGAPAVKGDAAGMERQQKSEVVVVGA